MADFKNEKDFEAWLEGKPRGVCVVLAARAALRVLPVVQRWQNEHFKNDPFREIMLPVFRAAGVAWVAAEYPAHVTRLVARAAAVAASDAADAAGSAAARAASAAAGAVADDYPLTAAWALSAASEAVSLYAPVLDDRVQRCDTC